jgi:outer membrane murein-binding lipoprotein Lpp
VISRLRTPSAVVATAVAAAIALGGCGEDTQDRIDQAADDVREQADQIREDISENAPTADEIKEQAEQIRQDAEQRLDELTNGDSQ